MRDWFFDVGAKFLVKSLISEISRHDFVGFVECFEALFGFL